ncbi:DnaJ family domain-containing protein [Thermoflexus sp.]|uniref:DnaJ family domain-containing protein n=1 Tax=Thermoflexus sp. TaxID=1969742 RepID=UPI0017AE495D|nr:DnaJ family domain-containing protein [Thermoflexus sp.]
MVYWGEWLEQKILEAMRQGAFEHLSGKGKPLPVEENPYLEPGLAIAYHILRQNDARPEWIEADLAIRRGIELARQDLQRTMQWREEALRALEGKTDPRSRAEREWVEAEWDRALRAFARRIAELNEQVFLFNLKVPIYWLQRFKFDLREELQALGVPEADITRLRQGDPTNGGGSSPLETSAFRLGYADF